MIFLMTPGTDKLGKFVYIYAYIIFKCYKNPNTFQNIEKKNTANE